MKCFVIFKENIDSNVNYVAVDEENLAATIDQRCLKDDEYIVIKGIIIKDTDETKMHIPANLMRNLL